MRTRKRQEEQQRQWKKDSNSGMSIKLSKRHWYYSYGGYDYGGQYYADPSIEFKKKYEESCDLLGVPYDADKYQIKLAYRRKAKEYHPDLNKSPNAKEIFQKINDANEFLSDANIERYKSLHN